ncbi:hypothetical protein BLOT_005524 [Blomia tropicalis]|nr:hypothetical protein BLOT_005524 [Blomia tropicalis]
MKARKDLALSGVCSSNSLHFRSPFQFNAPDGGGYVWDVLYSARNVPTKIFVNTNAHKQSGDTTRKSKCLPQHRNMNDHH